MRTRPDMHKLQADYHRHIAAFRREGMPLTSYACPQPGCNEVIEALVPPHEGQHLGCHDTLVTCPHCGDLHFRAVYSNGTVLLNGVQA